MEIGNWKREIGKAKKEHGLKVRATKSEESTGLKDPPLQAREKKPGKVRKGQECVA